MSESDGMISVPAAEVVFTSEQVTGPLDISVQLAVEDDCADELPSEVFLIGWAQTAYASFARKNSSTGSAEGNENTNYELAIRIVDKSEMRQLNREFRRIDKPTNVLSFGFDDEGSIGPLDSSLLGDIAICHSVVVEEAHTQRKAVPNHYAHMVVHGVLHLCGLDHQEAEQAIEMESIEVDILAERGVTNPYLNYA